jgi:hypothetical protein
MSINWSKFVSTHSTIIILLTFNIIIVILFTLLYSICHAQNNKSFNNSDPHSKIITTDILDHFLLSIAIQSGVGYASINPVSNTAKVLVSAQEFLVLTSSLLSIYLFIYLVK